MKKRSNESNRQPTHTHTQTQTNPNDMCIWCSFAHVPKWTHIIYVHIMFILYTFCLWNCNKVFGILFVCSALFRFSLEYLDFAICNSLRQNHVYASQINKYIYVLIGHSLSWRITEFLHTIKAFSLSTYSYRLWSTLFAIIFLNIRTDNIGACARARSLSHCLPREVLILCFLFLYASSNLLRSYA